MHIEELSAKTGDKYLTVTMSYEECRDIATGLYHASQIKEIYIPIYNKMRVMFDLIKEGMVMPETVEKLAEEQERKKEAEKSRPECDTRP